MNSRFAVLGDPIGHSLSPVLHRAGYEALGLDHSYDAFRVPEGSLAGFLASLDASWRGLSLTMPLKREALGLVAELSKAARMAGAANTLVRRSDGAWSGDNTDIGGAVAAIREQTAAALAHVVIWGGGATAASTLLAAAELGARAFTLMVRDRGRVEETLAAVARYPQPLEVRVADLGDPVDADLLISTIPAQPQESLVDTIVRAPVVFEVLYHPWPTPLARFAADRVLVTGLDLLVQQAALQFELFTGQPAPIAQLRDAGLLALQDR